MKRAYSAPTMEIEMFTPNQSVASGCVKNMTDVTKITDSIDVDCVADGVETIFTSGITGCAKGYVTDVDGGRITTYGGKYYYIWPIDGEPSQKLEGDKKQLIANIIAAWQPGTDPGHWHVGELSLNEYHTVNAS